MKKLIFVIPFLLQAVEIPDNINKIFDTKWNECDQVIERKRYNVCYSYKDKLPLYVVYQVKGEDNGCKNPRPHKFKYDNTITNKYRAKDQFYKRTGYDRGHLMPNAVINCDIKAQKETFILSNVAPQNPKMNRSTWKNLETYVRELSKKYDVWVQTGIIPGIESKKMKGQITYPMFFYKKLFYNNQYRIFVVPNENVKPKKYEDFEYFNTVNN